MVDNGSRLVFDVSSGGATSFGIFQSATDVSSMNFALFGRRESEPKAVERPIAAGGSSVKIPEDFSAAPVVINQHLVAADCGHFTIHLHTNSIDEFGICEITIAAVERRTI
jgi:urease subunit alpha